MASGTAHSPSGGVPAPAATGAPAALPVVAALDMGYGHLRAAVPLAEALGVPLVQADRPPVAGPDEARRWLRARSLYEGTSRGTQLPLIGGALRQALGALTAIEPLHPRRDQSRPTQHVRAVERAIASGLGCGLAAELDRSGRPLVATHFIPALAADRHGTGVVHCLVTDADLSRAWVAADPRASRVRYLAPTQRAARRLLAYGVPRERVRFTGFPLPGSLTRDVRRHLAARLVRLDRSGLFRESRGREVEALLGPLPDAEQGRAPLLVFAVGGAGAQVPLVGEFLSSLRPAIEHGKLRLALVAGTRADVADRLAGLVRAHGVESTRILHEPAFDAYYAAFNTLLADADVLWTKPSELTFYAALGLPLVLSQPLGVHESYNRRWARERGAALKQRDARHAWAWLSEWLDDGLLSAAAWAGWTQLPSRGTDRIVDAVTEA